MVKGISRQVIVVHSPDPKLFEQAIFILKDEAVGQGSRTRRCSGRRTKRCTAMRWTASLENCIFMARCGPAAAQWLRDLCGC